MRLFKMKDVDKIEEMLAKGLKVEVEWHSPYEKGTKVETVKYVRWDGLVFTTGDCIYIGIDKYVDIRKAT